MTITDSPVVHRKSENQLKETFYNIISEKWVPFAINRGCLLKPDLLDDNISKVDEEQYIVIPYLCDMALIKTPVHLLITTTLPAASRITLIFNCAIGSKPVQLETP